MHSAAKYIPLLDRFLLNIPDRTKLTSAGRKFERPLATCPISWHALFYIFTNTMLRLCLVPITLFLPLSCSAAASKHGHNEPHDLVRSSCAYASYSSVCLAILPKWL